VSGYAGAAILDSAAARELSLPLVQPARVPGVGSKKNVPLEGQVAIELQLPAFTQLNASDFLRLREDERPAFERFRKALHDQIKLELDSSSRGDSAGHIARNVEENYLRPELAEIEERFRGSRKALIRKSATSLTIGTSVATVGAIASTPLMIASAVVALGSTVPLAPIFGSYIDETSKELPMHELYFLWRLKKKGAHWSKHR
jgi:hypothetical protein